MSSSPEGNSDRPRRCFVVMGFGVKTDFATGRKLDLDKSYRLLIKPVVEEKGLVCVRADEIRHSGTIDVPMYQELLTADVVVADLSTANPNALYELGVRHALRPHTTVVISEKQLSYPFDLNHVVITSYTHLGEAIDFDEVMRFRKVLGDTLAAVLADQKTDSPVYTFLSKLTPPAIARELATAMEQAGDALGQAGKAAAASAAYSGSPEPQKDTTLSGFIEQGETAIKNSQFPTAKMMFTAVIQFCKSKSDGGAITQDPYLIQRLALATYKAKQPDEVTALNEALALLAPLSPQDSNDPETLGLAGAIEKRLFDKGQGDEHLNKAVSYYARGYYLKNDWYNGINFAFLLNVRANTPLDGTKEEQIADVVWANRIRREVLDLCEQELSSIHARKQRAAAQPGETAANEIKKEQSARDKEQEFWCLATKAEASFGLGQMDVYQEARADATALAHADWMMESFDGQIQKLQGHLEKQGKS